MRVLPVLLAAAVFAAPALAEKPTPDAKVTVEDNTYRFGDLYRSERGTTVEACAQMCTQESSCASWSLVPATFSLGPRCELKRNPGVASHRPGAVSGMSEFWQMDPSRHGEMRYQPQIPVGYQPAPVPVEQLDGSPADEPALVGGPGERAEIMIEPEPQIAAAPIKTLPPQAVAVEVARAPAQVVMPTPVKQPALDEPHPLYRKPVRTAQPSAVPTVFKSPAESAPQAQPASAEFNAVQKRTTQAVSAPVAESPVPPPPTPKPMVQPAPWAEPISDDLDETVKVSDIVADEDDATNDFLDGLSEVGF